MIYWSDTETGEDFITLVPEGHPGLYVCSCCGDIFSIADLRDLDDEDEEYWLDDGVFYCPDCADYMLEGDAERAVENLLGEEADA